MPEPSYSGNVSSLHQHPIWPKLVLLWKKHAQLTNVGLAEKQLYALLKFGRKQAGTFLNPEGVDLWVGDDVSDLRRRIYRYAFTQDSVPSSNN